MKVKELFLELKKIVDKHGDLEVVYTSSFKYHVCGEAWCFCHQRNHEFSIQSVCKYTLKKRGNPKVIRINLDGEERLICD